MAPKKEKQVIIAESLRRPEEEITQAFIDQYYMNETKCKIVDMIYRMRFMNTKDLQRALGYKSYPNLTKYIRELYEDRFITRRVKPYEDRYNGDRDIFHMLDKGGAMFIKDYYGFREDDEVKWHARENRVKYDFARHSLKISEIYSWLEKAARDNNGIIKDAYCDKHLFIKFYHGKEYHFYPDMFFKYVRGNNVAGFFIEVDMGTMAAAGSINTKSFDNKVQYYENYKLANKSFFGFNQDVFPRVLVLTTTKARAENLEASVKNKQKELGKSAVTFLFSTIALWENEKYGPLGKIFIDTKFGEEGSGLRSMFD